MLSGHYQGQLLKFLVEMIQPKTILEIGTYTGYSAIAMAEGLPEDGKLITIDTNIELEKLIDSFVCQAELKSKIEQHTGNALEIIPTLNQTFDLIFIDADKRNYRNYLDLVLDKVNPGGYIITDNVLWSGKVLEDYDSMDRETKILMDYNKMIHEDERVQEILLPIRDGLMIARKK
jgi:predicted O-methyltransferase YrrM